MHMDTIVSALKTALDELFTQAPPKSGQLLVVGCSTSEISGKKIGSSGSLETAKAVFDTISDVCKAKGLRLACQCCEHLNRALIVERETAERFGFPEVTVVPHEHAGGSFATAAYRSFSDPVAVETVQGDYGMDIGDTLIGMHLHPVAVPVRTSIKTVGEANLVLAKTRPKYIGGPRAQYE